MKNISDNLDSVFEGLKNPVRGIETGFRQLDDALLGFKPSELIVIAAPASMGKTSLLSDLALHASKSEPVAIFSAEMSFQILTERLITNIAGVNHHTIKKDGVFHAVEDKIKEAVEDLKKRHLYLDDHSGVSPTYIRNKVYPKGDLLVGELVGEADSLKQAYPRILFIDYLQIMRPAFPTGTEYGDVGSITSELKALAKELNVPIVLLSQLNRECLKRESHEPRLSDMRGSGKIEENADVVILIHRPDYFAIKEIDLETEETGEAFLHLAKNRNGPVGKFPVVWLSEQMSFRDINDMEINDCAF